MQMDYDITTKAAGFTQKTEMHIYVTDGYVYFYIDLNIPGEGEMKYKESLATATGLATMDELLGVVEELLDSLDASALTEISFGKDIDGNLVIQSSEELDAEYNNEYFA